MYLNLNKEFISESQLLLSSNNNSLANIDCKIRDISKYNAFVASAEQIDTHSTCIEITESLAEIVGIGLSPFNPQHIFRYVNLCVLC